MSDRELLELAAKAAGLVIGFSKTSPEQGRPYVWNDEKKKGRWWNPIEDDGDALRLAVKVGMVIRLSPYGDHWVDVEAGELLEISVHEESTHDPYYNTRLAIVRAAAEIGRQMEVA